MRPRHSLVRPLIVAAVTAVVAQGCGANEPTPSSGPPPAPEHSEATFATMPASLSEREHHLGLPKSPGLNRPYLSGVWLGGDFNAQAINDFGAWRGSPVETITTYSDNSTWQSIRNDWTITTWRGSDATLVYGLGLLPNQGGGTLRDVAAGKHDEDFRQVARNLVRAGRERSIVRVGFEANGTWFKWAGSKETATAYKDAFRRVAGVLKAEAPQLLIDFDLACGVPLAGSSDPLAPLTMLYPGDDVVDIIGCDTYDDKQLSFDPPEAIGKGRGPGLMDVYRFAQERNKPMSIPEWGLHQQTGSGDNPAYIQAMRTFLQRYGEGIVFENYFNEPNTDLRSSLWNNVQNPKAAEAYAWGW